MLYLIILIFSFHSWGTKGDNSVAKDLGVVTVSNKDKGVKTVEVELPAGSRDVDEQYDTAYANLLRAKKLPREEVSECFIVDYFLFH
jgi:chitin synthase